MNTKFRYLYRDGSNNKNGGEVIFGGTPASLDEASDSLESLFDEDQYFIAGQLGIPEIFLWNPDVEYNPDDARTYPETMGPGNYCIAEGVDHCWHEFDYLESTEAPPTDPRTIQKFIEDVRKAAAEGWKEFDPGSRITTTSQNGATA